MVTRASRNTLLSIMGKYIVADPILQFPVEYLGLNPSRCFRVNYVSLVHHLPPNIWLQPQEVHAQCAPVRKGIRPIPRSKPKKTSKNQKAFQILCGQARLRRSGLDTLHQTLPQSIAHVVEATDDILTLALAPSVFDLALPRTS
jgi:hypothetical protein